MEYKRNPKGQWVALHEGYEKSSKMQRTFIESTAKENFEMNIVAHVRPDKKPEPAQSQ